MFKLVPDLSILYVDLKVFTKILASMLQYTHKLIYPDQVGFVPCHEAKHNTARVLIVSRWGIPTMFLSTDAAFDRVD